MDGPISENERNVRYEILRESLRYLNLDGVELLPQTMAPFPWHFGGQRYQNLFVQTYEILHWCEQLKLRVCFDVSHSKLMSNFYKLDFYEVAKSLGALTAHIHIGDAAGINGEGLQIGLGEIDFFRMSEILRKNFNGASFIPEIWQGHNDRGQGFWVALDRLEGLL
jgi:N-acetylneuraminate synthase